ncbi:MAG: ABC transporter substrate-binding protein, partial [Bacteroidales bacterium]|nr:ABC transporter substrate-binding protein [Bacteroidales bacterium]
VVSSPGAWVFNELERLPDGSLKVLAINDTILDIYLRQAFPPFLGILTMPYCSVVLPEAVTLHGKDFRMRPVGTGPFRMAYWKEGVKLVLRKNPWYFEFEHGNRLPYLEAIAISFIIDKQAAFLEFIKGKLDFMSGLDPSYQDELLMPDGRLNPDYAGKVRLITQPYLNTEYLGFMLDAKDLPASASVIRDKRIRQAISYGFDREKMIRYLRNNIGTPGHGGFIPTGLPGYDSSGDIGYDYQPQKVRSLLAEAGYPEGKGLPPITLSTTAEYLDLCKYIQHELEQFGISILIDVNPPAALKEMKAQGKLPFFRGSWVADYPDAENYLSLFLSANHCPEGPNYFRYSSAQFDALYHKAMQETDPDFRGRLYHRMD